MENPKDLSNMKVGRLRVIEKTKQRNNGCVVWRCKCDCGNFTDVSSSYLRQRTTRSCGCLQKEGAHNRMLKMHKDKWFAEKSSKASSKANKKNLIGRVYGRLLVIKEMKVRNSNGSIIWECRCDCGNQVKVSSNSLLFGTKSCGCILKEYQENNIVDNTKLDNLTQKVRQTNQFGVKGISYRKKIKKYVVNIGFQRRQIYLGLYETIEEAIEARLKAEEKYFHPMLDKHGKEKNERKN